MKYAVLPAILTLMYTSLSLASNNTPPDVSWYQADLVVFLHTSSNTGEQWPEVKPHPLPAHAIALTPYHTYDENIPMLPPFDKGSSRTIDIKQDPFIALPESEYQLSEQIDLLKRSSEYKILTTAAWRLPVDSDDKDQSIVIKTPLTTNSKYLLNGAIAISSRRFLHVDVDLWYNELKPEALSSLFVGSDVAISGDKKPGERTNPTSTVLRPASSTEAPLRISRNFQLQERRRIQRTSEVQYLDSPVIGVLFKLTPYDRPDSKALPLPAELTLPKTAG